MLSPYNNSRDDKGFQLQMTLWAITRSPLFYGGDLRSPSLTAADFALLTNREVLAITDNTSHNRQVSATKDTYVWAADSADGNHIYVALFNIGTQPVTVSATFEQLGVNSKAHTCDVHDVWTHTALAPMTGQVAAHLSGPDGAVLWRLSRCVPARTQRQEEEQQLETHTYV